MLEAVRVRQINAQCLCLCNFWSPFNLQDFIDYWHLLIKLI